MRYVYAFDEGSKDQKDLLGGKGANLAEMTSLGLPVPPGFTITTEACRAYRSLRHAPEGLGTELREHLGRLEADMGRRLGDPTEPLLLSVRSGAKYSMPGMMETVLNIGLNDETVRALADETGDERFAWDSYRRLLQMFGRTVLDVPASRFDVVLEKAKAEAGAPRDIDLTPAELRDVVASFQERHRFGHRTRVSAGSERSARSSRPRGVPIVGRGPGQALPASRGDLRRSRHRGQRHGHGLRQPRRGQRHRCRLHSRPGERCSRRIRRLPAQRSGRRRRGRHQEHDVA